MIKRDCGYLRNGIFIEPSAVDGKVKQCCLIKTFHDKKYTHNTVEEQLNAHDPLGHRPTRRSKLRSSLSKPRVGRNEIFWNPYVTGLSDNSNIKRRIESGENRRVRQGIRT